MGNTFTGALRAAWLATFACVWTLHCWAVASADAQVAAPAPAVQPTQYYTPTATYPQYAPLPAPPPTSPPTYPPLAAPAYAPPAYPQLAAPVNAPATQNDAGSPQVVAIVPAPSVDPQAQLLPPAPTNVTLPSESAQPALLAPPGATPATPEAVVTPPAEAAAAPAEAEPAITIVEPIPEAPPKLWTGRIEAGINGADGNTQLFSSRFGTKLARETPRDKFKFDLLYGRSENFGNLTEHKAILEMNQDWNIGDSAYAWFVNSMTEYDEFRNFDVRLTLHSGLTYHARKSERGFLDLRAGAGTSREIGSPDNQFVPETKLGFDLEFKISPRQKLTGSSDAYVDVTDIGNVRVNSRAGYVIALDTTRNLNLEFGLLDRYDSTPNGAKPNDIDYNVLLFWGF